MARDRTSLFRTRRVGDDEDAGKMVCSKVTDKTCWTSERRNTLAPLMSAPSGLARRFYNGTCVNGIPAAPLRKYPTRSNMGFTENKAP